MNNDNDMYMKPVFTLSMQIRIFMLLAAGWAGMPALHAQVTIWGTTVSGGTANEGTIYSIRSDGSGQTVQYSFQADGIDGVNPLGGLTEGADQRLYGLTSGGGLYGEGTLF